MRVLPDGPWSVGQGTYDDRPIVVRVNSGASSLIGDSGLSHRVGVATPLRAPDIDGLPEAAESAELNALEDALDAALTQGTEALLLLVITTNGMREFVFHTSAPAAVADQIGAVRVRFPERIVQFMQEHDPTWDVYRQFSEA